MSVRLAVLGNPVAHSRSPEIHQLFGQQVGLDLNYEKLLVPENQFAETARAFLENAVGCNVTLPCKHDAYEFVDEHGDEARVAQAVNTISVLTDGRFRGDNTDGPGLVRDLTVNLGWQIRGSRLLLLGAGGAVSGVMGNLVEAAPALLHLHNRTRDRAEQLASRFDTVEVVSSGELLADYDIIINGTSAGRDGSMEHLPSGIINSGVRCYDMTYGAAHGVFREWCLAQADCTIADGLGMLVEQAALSFMLWFNKPVTTPDVIRRLRDDVSR